MTTGMLFSWVDLRRHLQTHYGSAEWTLEEVAALESFIALCKKAAVPIVFDEEARNSGLAIVELLPLNTRIMIHKYRSSGGWVRRANHSFMLCTGRMNADLWEAHPPGSSLARALTIIATPMKELLPELFEPPAPNKKSPWARAVADGGESQARRAN